MILFYRNAFFHSKKSVRTQTSNSVKFKLLINQNFIAILQWCQRFFITYFLLFNHFICHSSALHLHEKKRYTLNDKSNLKRQERHQINSKVIVWFAKNIYLTNVYWTIQFKRRNRLKYKDKLVIIELPFPDFITTLCIMKTISPENDRSFAVNPEFWDNPEKRHEVHTNLIEGVILSSSRRNARWGNWPFKVWQLKTSAY